MTALRHTWQVTLRYIRALVRQPAWVGITLVQPVIWLLLFGALFKSVARIPGFHGGPYIEFLTPGIVVMLAISSAGWSGMAYIDDMSTGVMDRFLVSPIWRGALNAGSVAQNVITIVIQSTIVAGLSLAVGGHFPNGVGGVAILIGVSALLGASFASLSNGLALLARQRETLIAAVTSITLPLTFLSSALMQQSLLPGWIRWTARFNPVNWAVEAGRSAATQRTDWNLVLTRTGMLAALLLVSASLATQAFRSYQHSV
jgi:ABC-2 type transport system permease protein